MRTPLCAPPHGAPGCRCPFVLTPPSKARILPRPQPEEGAGPGATSTLTSPLPFWPPGGPAASPRCGFQAD